MAANEEEKERTARQLRELFSGRFSHEEVRAVLRNFDWDYGAAADFIWKAEPARVRQLVNKDEAVIRAIQRETIILGRMLTTNWRPRFQVRQFACDDCDMMWWRKVTTRKPVSKCNTCKTKYDAIPRCSEYGLAEFHCHCGNVFRGFGWMGKTVSPCYKCRPQFGIAYVGREQAGQRREAGGLPPGLCWPTKVLPPSDRKGPNLGRRRGVDTHCCNARNCWRKLSDPDVPILEEDACVHPKSRMRKALLPSQRHVSTGSTVDTWLTQDDLRSAWNDAASTLDGIPEEDNEDDDDDDDDYDDIEDDDDDDDSNGNGGETTKDEDGFEMVYRRRRRGGGGNNAGRQIRGRKRQDGAKGGGQAGDSEGSER